MGRTLCSLACTFLPTLITVLVQKHISPVTVSFIYILEPILGAVIAMFYLHELLPIQGYTGGLLVVEEPLSTPGVPPLPGEPSTEQSAGAAEERSGCILATSGARWACACLEHSISTCRWVACHTVCRVREKRPLCNVVVIIASSA